MLAQTGHHDDLATEHTDKEVPTPVEVGGADGIGKTHVVVPGTSTDVGARLAQPEPVQLDHPFVVVGFVAAEPDPFHGQSSVTRVSTAVSSAQLSSPSCRGSRVQSWRGTRSRTPAPARRAHLEVQLADALRICQ